MLVWSSQRRRRQWHGCICPDWGSLRRTGLRRGHVGQEWVVTRRKVCFAVQGRGWRWWHECLHQVDHSLHDLSKISHFLTQSADLWTPTDNRKWPNKELDIIMDNRFFWFEGWKLDYDRNILCILQDTGLLLLDQRHKSYFDIAIVAGSTLPYSDNHLAIVWITHISFKCPKLTS